MELVCSPRENILATAGEIKSVLLFDEATKVGVGWRQSGTRSGFKGNFHLQKSKSKSNAMIEVHFTIINSKNQMINVSFSVQPIAVLSLQVRQRKVSYTIAWENEHEILFWRKLGRKKLEQFFWLKNKLRNLNRLIS